MILAVGETLDLDFARASGLKLNEHGSIDVDRFTLESSRPRFFAGGDAITGASNVSNAMGLGKKAARKIDERLMGIRRWDRLACEFDFDGEPPEGASESPRHHSRELQPAVRVQGR